MSATCASHRAEAEDVASVETGAVQEDVHDLFADLVDEGERNAAAIIVDAIAALQTQVRHVASMCPTRTCLSP